MDPGIVHEDSNFCTFAYICPHLLKERDYVVGIETPDTKMIVDVASHWTDDTCHNYLWLIYIP